MIELKPIRVLRAVSDLKSFSQAARALDLAPASVTRIINQLEQDLGAQLLVRTTRQVALTSAGATVLSRYRPLLEGFEEVTQDLQRSIRPDAGHLRLTAPISLGIALLPQVIAGFRLAYPGISVEINFTDTLIDVIEENCDLAVRVSGPPTDKSTIWRKLCEVPRRAIAAPALFNRQPSPQHPDDLIAAPLMSYGAKGEPEQWSFARAGAQRTVRAGKTVISNNGDFLYAMARIGEGICVLPDFITADGLQSGAVIEVLPDWSIPSLWLTLFYPPYERLPPVVGTFADYFEAFIDDHPDLRVPV
ncbi:MAG: LysR family transcriptional regulator [Tateyamaria sp.]|uniref:LysR family transcriptional regulator n=1 Tax=Tateyamaria sp. TaxID=1929288 RepID=UPI003279490E